LKEVDLFKALGDETRLKILDMLSCGELCACEIIECLHLTQPTISHHMKILQGVDLVKGRKNGKWTHYSINKEKIEATKEFLDYIVNYKENCICNKINKNQEEKK
jgi:ArsR family transcriptional regulator, arsenate/arsenite/antimonite-responsive transcriptional repressor